MRSHLITSMIVDADPDTVAANSIKDLHVKGFDYICLHRSPALTVKLYVFEGDVAKAPEVVNPHDHRYDFQTTVLAGGLEDRTYLRVDGPAGVRGARVGERYQRFEWRTPLLGGGGFTWAGESFLAPSGLSRVDQRSIAVQRAAEEIHTIRIAGDRTALLLLQGADRPGLEFTTTYTKDREPPSIDGCYGRLSVDEINDRLHRIGLGRLGARHNL